MIRQRAEEGLSPVTCLGLEVTAGQDYDKVYELRMNVRAGLGQWERLAGPIWRNPTQFVTAAYSKFCDKAFPGCEEGRCLHLTG